MRRHAEGLIILSGSTPGRGWREPVPVVDVLRAAVAEVEDYVRVDVVSESRDLVAGNAVNDVIHLVAELVENATVFSPPNTRIEVRADRVGTGLVAEVEDRGLGPEPRGTRRHQPAAGQPARVRPRATASSSGLFVVSRLAARHDIKVSLRQSVYGGTTAIVLLPFGVIVREEEAGRRRRRGDGPGDGRVPAARTGPAPAGRPSPPARPARTRRPRPHRGMAARHRGPTRVAAWGDRRPASRCRAAVRSTRRRPRHQAPPRGSAGSRRARSGHRGSSPGQPAPSRRGRMRPTGPTGRSRRRRTAWPAAARCRRRPGSHLGMPIRVPQASLAPQLRARGGSASGRRTPATVRRAATSTSDRRRRPAT